MLGIFDFVFFLCLVAIALQLEHIVSLMNDDVNKISSDSKYTWTKKSTMMKQQHVDQWYHSMCFVLTAIYGKIRDAFFDNKNMLINDATITSYVRLHNVKLLYHIKTNKTRTACPASLNKICFNTCSPNRTINVTVATQWQYCQQQSFTNKHCFNNKWNLDWSRIYMTNTTHYDVTRTCRSLIS